MPHPPREVPIGRTNHHLGLTNTRVRVGRPPQARCTAGAGGGVAPCGFEDFGGGFAVAARDG